MRKTVRFTILFLLTTTFIFAQQPKKLNSSEIYEAIQKLNFLGSVLYLGAHPDDENTRLISYFSNQVHARTAYLSMTRGDGGQNLIGSEIGELLGVIRTEELLAARRIDGGEQRFTRANDFGYSKNPEETLSFWNKDEVLSDVVLAIRQFKPDIIINRFDHRTPGETHGHHTSSALLSIEAFDLTSNKNIYPNQLEQTQVWQPKRLYFNTGWWMYGSRENFEKADKTNMVQLDIGVYYPTLGLSNDEIASLSRSAHKSQGFGSTGNRGQLSEYIEFIKGDPNPNSSNVFEGIDTSWNRVKGGKVIGDLLKKVENDFDFKNPSASIPKLVEAYKLIQNLDEEHWKAIKSEDLKNIIAACAGLYLEVSADDNLATTGELVNLNIEAINRSSTAIFLENVAVPNQVTISKNEELLNNIDYNFKESVTIDANQKPTTPYWLTSKGTLGMYKVEDVSLIGLPETPRALIVTFNLIIENVKIPFTKPVIYKTNDPVKGEVYKPFEVIPEATAKLSEKVIFFDNANSKEIAVVVRAGRDSLEGYISLALPKDWSVYPEKQKVTIANKGQEQTIVFTVIPPKNENEGLISPMVHVGDRIYTRELVEIDYDHLPHQTVLLPSESKIARLNIEKRGENIGYIEGAGDAVPESLRQIGYNVVVINPNDINPELLSRFDAIVVGVRAYNTVDELKFKQQFLFDFVAKGGNLIVQYNTNFRLKVDKLAPYDLNISRDRVTEENSKVRFLNPDHPILNYPNKISEKAFEGWTQERGLYFPDQWDSAFTPILSMNDKDDSPKNGSLLVAKYGQGHYIYSTLSFFRELPEGVTGAYKLFANMLSIGKDNIKTKEKFSD